MKLQCSEIPHSSGGQELFAQFNPSTPRKETLQGLPSPQQANRDLICQHLYQSSESSCPAVARRDHGEELKGQHQARWKCLREGRAWLYCTRHLERIKPLSKEDHPSLPNTETSPSAASEGLKCQSAFLDLLLMLQKEDRIFQ